MTKKPKSAIATGSPGSIRRQARRSRSGSPRRWSREPRCRRPPNRTRSRIRTGRGRLGKLRGRDVRQLDDAEPEDERSSGHRRRHASELKTRGRRGAQRPVAELRLSDDSSRNRAQSATREHVEPAGDGAPDRHGETVRPRRARCHRPREQSAVARMALHRDAGSPWAPMRSAAGGAKGRNDHEELSMASRRTQIASGLLTATAVAALAAGRGESSTPPRVGATRGRSRRPGHRARQRDLPRRREAGLESARAALAEPVRGRQARRRAPRRGCVPQRLRRRAELHAHRARAALRARRGPRAAQELHRRRGPGCREVPRGRRRCLAARDDAGERGLRRLRSHQRENRSLRLPEGGLRQRRIQLTPTGRAGGGRRSRPCRASSASSASRCRGSTCRSASPRRS